MSNRIAWVAVVVVVLVVGLLVFRSLEAPKPDAAASRTGDSAAKPQDESAAAPDASTDSLARAPGQRLSSVHRAQVALQGRGFYSGPIDGNYSAELRDAIVAFQKANGMKQDGYLNQKLYDALGISLNRRSRR